MVVPELQVTTGRKMETVGGLGSVVELPLLRMLEGLGSVDGEPAALGQPEFDPAVVAENRSLLAIDRNRKTHLESSRDPLRAGQRNEERMEIGAIPVAFVAGPESVPIPPTRTDLFVFDVVDHPIVDCTRRIGLAVASGSTPNFGEDRLENRVADDDALVRAEKSLSRLRIPCLVARSQHPALDLVVHANRNRL